jgi:aspartyl protease family protein
MTVANPFALSLSKGLRHSLTFIVLALASATVSAQGVALSGVMGNRALLVIDGQPQMLAVGASAKGVKLLELRGEEARVERDGKSLTLRVGGAPVSMGAAARAGAGREIVMTASSGGHFITDGAINGRAVRFMVDTGATTIAMGVADAERLGINWKNGERGLASTANGVIATYRVNLASVRVGDVEVNNVDASVSQSGMPYVLLGNSFLTRFSMRRDNDVMRLERR